ncbi:MAG TPA: hypothetical protein VHD14_01460 [Pseudolabrys sp.]|nr:hypothetical protein [Pseudolabrys sp.]
MSKFGAFLARKSGAADKPAETAEPTAPLEVDEELFSALGAQLGGENEALRNLLLDANHKIGELDAIRDAVGKLVEPVGKALRAFEAEKSEKVSLQTVLNNTRAAYGKLRNEISDLEKKAATFEAEANRLRQEATASKNQVRTLEAAKSELSGDVATLRTQIADLEGRLQHEISETKALREENRRLDERLVGADKRIVQFEFEINSVRQRLVVSEDEKRALQSALDRTVAETTRRLAEAESTLTMTQGRLRHVEANFTEANTERSRLATMLDEIKERHENELSTQRMRFEALQARSASTEKLLGEAREHIMARTEEIRAYDRRLAEAMLVRDTLSTRFAELEAEHTQYEAKIKEFEQSQSTLLDRNAALARALNGKESALNRAGEAIQVMSDRIAFLQAELETSKQTAAEQLEEANAALRREKLERAVVEGALETGRKDFARLMREVLALQRRQAADESGPDPVAANAA